MAIGVLLLSILLPADFCLKHFLSFSTAFLLSRIYFWAVLAGMIFYALKVEKQKFLLYEEQKYPFKKILLMIFLIVVIILFGNAIISFILKSFGFSGISAETKAVYLLFKESYLLLIFTCITAGVTEELLFRGYLQTRLEKLFNNAWLGIIISSLIFGLMHMGWHDLLQLIGTFWIGLVFAFFYYKYKNIKILVLLHIFYDLISMSLKLFLVFNINK